MYWNKSILGNELFQNVTFEDVKLPSTWREEIPHLQKIYLEKQMPMKFGIKRNIFQSIEPPDRKEI